MKREIEAQDAPPEQAGYQEPGRVCGPGKAEGDGCRDHDRDAHQGGEAQPRPPQLLVQVKDLHGPDPRRPPELRPGVATVATFLQLMEEADDEDVWREIGLVLRARCLRRAGGHPMRKVSFPWGVK